MLWSSESPKANHCDVCRLVIRIVTAVTPLVYVQVILTPTLLVGGIVVVITVLLDKVVELIVGTVVIYKVYK
jgi:hypothetical protein